ncbi:hypothetical protein GIB67_034273 [Kingdonia uniflora]|uniref:Peptidase M28 domain-containing protein n=1 Tax=Kingdonia uniflora TaxID=39325 RepID=A0A7J7NRQ2_9MAGN|nr:hypothetical protein GIB67_034273 [Kingdonia uniflora]
MAQPHSTPKPIFTALPSSSPILAFITFLCVSGLYIVYHPTSNTSTTPNRNTPTTTTLFLTSSNNYTISSYLRDLTLHPHLAGTKASLETVKYVENHFKGLNLETHNVEFEALLSYPGEISLDVYLSDGVVRKLELSELGYSGRVVVPYHAYSPSGSVFGKVVFVNYGREEDYRVLEALGVNVSGCVAIVRKGEVFRGGVVVRGSENGIVAVLIYGDGDRFNGVERGTVMKGLGDPLTPGWGGVEGGEKLGWEENEVKKRFPKIPSMPISAENAEIILGSLEGVEVPYEWRVTLHSKVGGVGAGPTLVNFTYQEQKKVVKIHNVFAVIRGWEELDRYVLLGNHRDAWTYGAVDPNSGTAALLDIARRYALLTRSGWAPRRTIVLCSWDAEEFGMVGNSRCSLY